MARNKDLFERVKRATVAIALARPFSGDRRKPPYEIIGTGFCIHRDGIVVTCNHVLETFMPKPIVQQIADAGGPANQPTPAVSITPAVMFFDSRRFADSLAVFPVPAATVIGKMDFDLAMIRVPIHAAFKAGGYPTVEIEPFEDIHEGMEIATCGFPLGNYLGDQIGTVTSSFTKGILSSIIPTGDTPEQYVKGFQLNLTATHGNSGGPVFSMESGKVFGVLQRGIATRDGQHMHGLTKAEPVYPMLRHDTTGRILKTPLGQLPSFG